MESTLTTKGQITLPKALRAALHLKSGDKIVFEILEDGSYVLKPKTLDVRVLKGSVSYKGKAQNLEDMQNAIIANAAK
jgi:AbrB family looped-hinge helix DNA binding protein